MGYCAFLQGIFPTQGLNLSLSNCRQILYCLSHQGSPLESPTSFKINNSNKQLSIKNTYNPRKTDQRSKWIFGTHPQMWWASLVAQTVKNRLAVQETQVQSLGRDNPLEKGMTTYSSFLAWKMLWTEEPG